MRSLGRGSAICLLGAGLAEASDAPEAAVTLDARGLSDRSALGLGHPLSTKSTGQSGAFELWTRSTARASPGACRTSKAEPSLPFTRHARPARNLLHSERVPIETMSLRVPAEQRADFLARAARLVQRADSSRASRTEVELALGVLSVLCGAARAPADPAQGVEP